MSFTLRNATVVVDSTTVLPGHSVVVRDGVIASVAPDGPEAANAVDCGGRVLCSGLINAHDHFYGRAAMGMALQDAPPASFVEILERLWWKLDRALTSEAVRLSAYVCMAEALLAGTTTMIDHHSSPCATAGSLSCIAEAAQELGVRVSLAYEVSDRNGSVNAAEALAENARFAAAAAGQPRLGAMFGLHAAFTLSDNTLREAVRLAGPSATFHIHACEGPEDVGAIARLASLGILNERTLLGHCVHVTEDDVATIARHKASIVINPESNLNNHVGLPNAEQFVAKGVRVLLGTDGMTQDMVQTLRTTLLHYPARLAPTALSFLLDNNAAAASAHFGRNIGHIKAGFAADLCLFEYVPPTPLTGGNLAWHFQYGIKAVHSVWVEGVQKVANGRLVGPHHLAGAATALRSVVERVVWPSPELLRFPEPASLLGRDFLRTWDFSLPELHSVLRLARRVRSLHGASKSCAVLRRNGLAVSNFRDKSTRTRLAFASGAALIGLQTFAFDEAVSQIGHGETVRETATMISFTTEVIGVRDDLFLGLGEAYMREVVDGVKESEAAGMIFAGPRPTLLNLQSDMDHPTQTLSDVLHLQSLFGPSLRGKRICVSWAYSPSYGKPLSVPGGLISLLPRFGMHVTLAHPPGFELQDEVMQAASRGADEGGGTFRVVHSMDEGVAGVDVVYAKSWGSMEFMRARRDAHVAGAASVVDGAREKAYLDGLKSLAAPWQYDEAKRGLTNGAVYMHCLPADISGVSCQQGEVAQETFERHRLATYREASWKAFVCAAIMLLQRVQDPNKMLPE